MLISIIYYQSDEITIVLCRCRNKSSQQLSKYTVSTAEKQSTGNPFTCSQVFECLKQQQKSPIQEEEEVEEEEEYEAGKH